jgi:hypothetical protein
VAQGEGPEFKLLYHKKRKKKKENVWERMNMSMREGERGTGREGQKKEGIKKERKRKWKNEIKKLRTTLIKYDHFFSTQNFPEVIFCWTRVGTQGFDYASQVLSTELYPYPSDTGTWIHLFSISFFHLVKAMLTQLLLKVVKYAFLSLSFYDIIWKII